MPAALRVTTRLRRSDATAMLTHSSADSVRVRNSVTGPCVETNDPRGAGKKNSAITLISTMAAVSKFANRVSITSPTGRGART